MKPKSPRPVYKRVQQMNLTGILSDCRCALKEIYYWKRKMAHRSQEKQKKFPFLHSTYYLLFLDCLKLFVHLFLLFDVTLRRKQALFFSSNMPVLFTEYKYTDLFLRKEWMDATIHITRIIITRTKFVRNVTYLYMSSQNRPKRATCRLESVYAYTL